MVIVCECGGHVQIKSATEDGDDWVEHYECEICGSHGEISMKGGRESIRGCLVENGSY